MIKKTFTIKDMHCSSCVMRIEGIEDDLPGIRRISASYQKQQMVIEYDEDAINEGQIIKAVEKLGYHVEMN
jgi:copper chaperone CopZ